jgi:dihydrofolate reductase
MTLVTAQMSVSLDGFYAGPRDATDPTGPEEWMASPEALGFFRITRWVIDAFAWRERLGFAGGERNVNSELVEETMNAAGAYIMGRRMFNGGVGPWGDVPPFRAPVFVVTHHARDSVPKEGGTTFHFVTDGIASAIEQARAVAGGKDVAVAGGGRLLAQVIKEGRLDQLDLHVAPVLLGDGMRLFDPAVLDLAGDEAIELTPTRIVETPEVTHLRYRFHGRAPLVLDDRGAGETADVS